MNAVVQYSLRAGRASDEHAPLSPESCHVLPSGNRMPLLGLGTWHLTFHTIETVCSALEIGFRMIDTAADYHTQRGIGDAIKSCGFDRDAIYVITKVEP
jgi:diketogulonate reductase-like aldo/keto reductase